MIIVAIISVVCAAVIGLAAKYLLALAVRKRMFLDNDKQITWFEYGIALAIVAILVAPAVVLVGKSLSVDQKLQYQEMYNGVEVAAEIHPTQCYAGHSGESYSAGESNCSHTYVSGHYSWDEPRQVCTGSGKDQTCTTVYDTYYGDIYTPYAATELTYAITNSFGQTYTYPNAYVAADGKPFGSRAIPPDVPRGAPADWNDAKQRLAAGDPRPVTDVFTYDNYILASGDTMLAPYSADMQSYLDQKLLPDHTANILDNPIYGDSRKQAKKLSFIGVSVPNENEWQEALMRFNAALGSKLQGDLHVVAIDSKRVDNPQRYLKALRAYWLSDHFGKRALSKNGIILVIGVNGNKIDWAQADTGMPYGNNTMLRTMENLLDGALFTPDAVFGHPRTVVTPAPKEGDDPIVNVTLSEPNSPLELAMFGSATQFKRPCMKCEGENDAGGIGYKDLVAQIEPSTSQKTWMVVVVCAFSLIFWGFVAFTSVLERGRVRKIVPRSTRRQYYW